MTEEKMETNTVIEDMQGRGVFLHHACQLQDFITYCNLGGVPSRQHMEGQGEFTSFDTDDNDENNGVWDMVFFNLSDLGTGFHQNLAFPPLAYGPIQLVWKPAVLNTFNDVAVSVVSAGSPGFDRSEHKLTTLDQWQRLFVTDYPRVEPYWVKTKTQLVNDSFPWDQVFGVRPEQLCNPELSCCSSENPGKNVAKWEDGLLRIIVDPIQVGDKNLYDTVVELAKVHGLPEPKERKTRYGDVFAHIVQKIADESKPYWETLPEEYKAKWKDYKKQYQRYVKYTREGTIGLLREQADKV